MIMLDYWLEIKPPGNKKPFYFNKNLVAVISKNSYLKFWNRSNNAYNQQLCICHYILVDPLEFGLFRMYPIQI